MPKLRITKYQRFLVFARIQDGSQHPEFSFLGSPLRYPFLHPAHLGGLMKGSGETEVKYFSGIFVVRVTKSRQAHVRLSG